MSDREQDIAQRDRWRWVRRLGPWVITLAVVAAILIRYPAGRIFDEMGRGNVLALVPAALGGVVGLWFTATIGDFVLIAWLVGPIRFWDLFRGKAGVAVLNALGLAANYGGHALWIQRRFGCSPGTAVGLLIMVSVADLFSVAVLASLAVWIGGDALPADGRAQLRIAAPIVCVAAAILVLWPSGRSRAVFDPWRLIPLRHRLLSLAMRCANIGILIVSTWVAARWFGMRIPFSAVTSYLPVLLVVGALPINVAGFGPVQAAWLALFGPWAAGEQILAFQFLWHMALFVALFLRGAPFLRTVVGDVAAGRRRVSPPPASPAATPGPRRDRRRT